MTCQAKSSLKEQAGSITARFLRKTAYHAEEFGDYSIAKEVNQVLYKESDLHLDSSAPSVWRID